MFAALLLSPSALAAGPASVTVRVEGTSETLLAPTTVTTNTTPVIKDGNPAHSCNGTSAAGALELATGGNWGGEWYSGLGYSVETIEGQSYPFTQPYYWSFWVNDKPASTGICETELNPGDSVLFFPECFSETSGVCPTAPSPLGLEAPAVAEVGKPVSVVVSSYANPSGAVSPAAGATVTVAGTSASATTDSEGRATLTVPAAGSYKIDASAPSSVRTEASLCVHNGNDGSCGTTAPSGSTSSSTGSTVSTAYVGPFALVPRLTSVLDGRVYSRAKSPRLLAGTISAHSAVTSVSLKLRREYRHRCYAYDGLLTEFRPARCGAGSYFKVSSDGSFSYLLPAALAPGRYVLDISATDAAGNRTTLARGTSRIVFYVSR